tara:strand:- start:6281 stop:6781 length:501 start_codon:yes stop_codon:yes gene_type:complete
MRLSRSFNISEFLNSNVSIRLGLKLDPPNEHIDNMSLLCRDLLQPLRDKLARPIKINSGWRSYELNKAIGGAYKIIDGKYIPTSQHCKGQAADLKFIDNNGKMNNKILFDTVLEMGLEFDQMINEFNYSWIHISYNKGNNRNQLLEAYKNEDNKTIYQNVINYKGL